MQRAVLLISGLDPSGGAGLLADVRVVHDHRGLFPLGVASALTVQDSSRAYHAEPVSMTLVHEQIQTLSADFNIAAVKIGLLVGADDLIHLLEALAPLRQSGVPVIWDPVLAPSHGTRFVHGNERQILERLSRILTLVLPNVGELETLIGEKIVTVSDLEHAAEHLAQQSGVVVLAKGGHLEIDGPVPHVLADGHSFEVLMSPRSDKAKPRGTGCALATEVACQLALQKSVRTAIVEALDRTGRRIDQAERVSVNGPPFLHSLNIETH